MTFFKRDKKQSGVELQEIKHPTFCTLEETAKDTYKCSFTFPDKQSIEATIVRTNDKAQVYQFRFEKEADATKVLDWIKEESSEIEKSQARVTPPKHQGQRSLFRLVGEAQWQDFQKLASPRDDHTLAP